MESRVRVLIVDDQARARASLKALLVTEPRVEAVREAANGEQAIALALEWKPDVILMDVRMRDVDGLQATRAIKLSAPQARVIVLTLYPEYREPAFEAGAQAFFVKGAPSEQLLKAILE